MGKISDGHSSSTVSLVLKFTIFANAEIHTLILLFLSTMALQPTDCSSSSVWSGETLSDLLMKAHEERWWSGGGGGLKS